MLGPGYDLMNHHSKPIARRSLLSDPYVNAIERFHKFPKLMAGWLAAAWKLVEESGLSMRLVRVILLFSIMLFVSCTISVLSFSLPKRPTIPPYTAS